MQVKRKKREIGITKASNLEVDEALELNIVQTSIIHSLIPISLLALHHISIFASPYLSSKHAFPSHPNLKGSPGKGKMQYKLQRKTSSNQNFLVYFCFKITKFPFGDGEDYSCCDFQFHVNVWRKIPKPHFKFDSSKENGAQPFLQIKTS